MNIRGVWINKAGVDAQTPPGFSACKGRMFCKADNFAFNLCRARLFHDTFAVYTQLHINNSFLVHSARCRPCCLWGDQAPCHCGAAPPLWGKEPSELQQKSPLSASTSQQWGWRNGWEHWRRFCLPSCPPLPIPGLSWHCMLLPALHLPSLPLLFLFRVPPVPCSSSPLLGSWLFSPLPGSLIFLLGGIYRSISSPHCLSCH